MHRWYETRIVLKCAELRWWSDCEVLMKRGESGLPASPLLGGCAETALYFRSSPERAAAEARLLFLQPFYSSQSVIFLAKVFILHRVTI